MAIATIIVACGGAEKKAEETMTEEISETVEVMEFTINAADSKAVWEGTMLGLYSHSGTVNITSGNVKVEGDAITGGNFVADLTTIFPTDENYSDEEGHTKADLVGHLSSGDFFMVDSFPTASFEVVSHNIENNSVTGNLTIRGITNEESVEDVNFNTTDGVMTGNLVFDRTKYNVAFSHPAEEMVLSDDISLAVKLVK